jgi:protein subunit release factor B
MPLSSSITQMRKKKEKKNRLMNSSSPKFDTDIDLLKRQVTVETYRSSGPGGQRKNKTETAVRLKHLPSGITVTATEHRSQAQNLNLAFERLRERLLHLSRPKKRRVPTRVPRKAKEARIEEKKSRSTKKRFRQKPQGEFE